MVYGDKTFEWEQGRLLSKVQTANEEISLFYDHNGLRTNKIVYNGLETRTESYKYDGNKLVSMRSMKNALDDTYDRKFVFVYNSNGIIGFVLDGSYYYYVKNEFGDVVAIVDNLGNTVAKYFYDAWGNVLVEDGNRNPITDLSHIAHLNPIRYRGYFYDTETNLALVSSRYYSPELGRFIQPADVSSLNPSNMNGLNLYAYANNNPIGIAYSNSGAGFSISGKMMSSLAISGSIILGYGSSNKGFYWPNLDFLGTGFGYIENSFSMIAGVIDGVRKIKHLDKLAGLDKASNWLMGIGIGINVGLSLYNNLTNSNLSSAQKAGNIVGDIVYIAASSVATWGVAVLTVMIPIVGPFLAPVVGFGFGTALEQFWHGEDIFGIEGFSFNPGGKSIDEWIKEFLTELFGG